LGSQSLVSNFAMHHGKVENVGFIEGTLAKFFILSDAMT
jgi:hypothetical protein